MEINPNIFKSYDIRGVYPSELNEEAVFAVAKSFTKKSEAKNVVICQDARLSSPKLFKALAGGILTAGAKVYDIGQAPTECLYFAVANYEFDLGVMITASHNPKEYNGMKVVKQDGHAIRIFSGKDLIPEKLSDGFLENKNITIEKKDIWKDFSRHVLSFIDLSEITPLKIVVDASNGVAGLAISKIKDALPVEIIPLNFNPDGNFPNHGPNPLLPENQKQISQAVLKEKADLGIIFDGDGDRVFLVDETGQIVRADSVLLILAKYLLAKNPGSAVAYNAICSKAVPEFIKKWGGKPIRTKVGFVFVQQGLIENDGIMGGELSAHYCFRGHFYADSGIMAFLILLQIISKDGRKVSEIIKEVSPYAKGAEINFEVKDKDAVLEKVKEKYSDGKQDFLDGVTVEYKDWWFNVRPSNTEPLLRLTIEADTEGLLAEKQRELIRTIGSTR